MVQFNLGPDDAVERSVEIPVATAIAFQRFTAEIGRWWPHMTHSVGLDQVAEIVLEGHVGGRLYERHKDGTEHNWGYIRVWDPPSRVVMTWHPGYEGIRETEVEIRFSPTGAGTRVTLSHRGWQAFAERAHEMKLGYADGWQIVLYQYVQSVESL